MIAMAVAPIEQPISARRIVESGIIVWTGEVGYSRSAVNRQAEIMKTPSSAPSMKYSGKWSSRSASQLVVPVASFVIRSPRATDSPAVEWSARPDPLVLHGEPGDDGTRVLTEGYQAAAIDTVWFFG